MTQSSPFNYSLFYITLVVIAVLLCNQLVEAKVVESEFANHKADSTETIKVGLIVLSHCYINKETLNYRIDPLFFFFRHIMVRLQRRLRNPFQRNQ